MTSAFVRFSKTGTYFFLILLLAALALSSGPSGASAKEKNRPARLAPTDLPVCASSTAISVGVAFNGNLQSGDCAFPDGVFFDVLTFSGTTGQPVSVNMTSTAFDTYLYLYGPDGLLILENDDSGLSGTNSRVPIDDGVFILPKSGTYSIVASSFEVSSGSYSVTLNTDANCTTSPITVGTPVTGAIAATDCKVNGGGDIYYTDFYSFSGTAGQTLFFTLSTTTATFDPYLILRTPSGNNSLEDDDSGGGTTARIPGTNSLSLPETGTYILEVSGYSPLETGNYTLSATAGACAPTISPISSSAIAGGGSGSVAVTAGGSCSWTAVSNASWITITSGASGSGNGTVGYTVAANSGPARTGTVTIGGQTFTVNQASGCTYTLGASSASPSAAGGAASVTVTAGTGCSWTAVSNASWITITSGASGSGNGTVGYTVAANTGPARTGTVTIGGQTFTVNQASGCTYTLGASSATTVAAGGSGTVSVTAGTGCTWTASSNDSWITVTSGSPGSGNGTVGYSVAANTGPARTGTVTIGGQTFTISQAIGCTYTLGAGSASAVAAGGSLSVSVTAVTGCAWTAASNDSWITIASGASGSGNGTVGLTVAANTGPARTGTVTIGGQTFTVNQASGCTFSLTPGSASSVATAGVSGSFALNSGAGCSWTAVSNDAWITVTSGASGSGNGTVGYTVAANTGAARTGTITAGGQTFTIGQLGGCTYALGASSASPSAAGGAASVSVTAGTGCSWTASSNDSWITVTSGASGSGSGTVGYTVAANTGPARTGTVTVGGQTFTVNQASGCTFTVSPSGPQTVVAAGGNVVFTVTAATGCTWSSGSETPWIVVATGQGGNGNGTVTLAVSANTGSARTGTASVAGQTVTIEQAAAAQGSIAGTVRYYFGTTPAAVGGVTVTGSGTTTVTATTDSTGAYSLQNFSTGPYNVSVSKTGQVNGISSLDASRVAQAVVQLITLTPNQIVAADATNNGGLSSSDASRIAQTAAGITNPGIAGTWKFVPPTRSYSSVTSAVTGEDYTAILVGDVTGNWSSAIPLSEGALMSESLLGIAPAFELKSQPQETAGESITAKLGSTDSVDVSLPELRNIAVGETLRIPIRVGDLTGRNVTAFDLELSFDPSVMRPLAVESAGSLSANFVLTANGNVDGRVRLSAFGVAPVSGEGDLVYLTFEVVGQRSATKIKLENFVFNEGDVPSRTKDGTIRIRRNFRGR